VFGVLFVVMLFVSGDTPGEGASAKDVLAHYEAHKGAATLSALLGPLAGALIVLFFAQLRTLARERAVAPGAGPTVMVAGAVLWAGGMLLAQTVQLGLATAADHGQAQVAQTLNVLDNDDWIPFIAGLAISLLGAGLTVLATGILPRWLGWVALVVGIVSLSGPGGFLGFFVAPVWMIVAGVVAFLRTARPGVPSEPAGMPLARA
jgi:hypothetical protein